MPGNAPLRSALKAFLVARRDAAAPPTTPLENLQDGASELPPPPPPPPERVLADLEAASTTPSRRPTTTGAASRPEAGKWGPSSPTRKRPSRRHGRLPVSKSRAGGGKRVDGVGADVIRDTGVSPRITTPCGARGRRIVAAQFCGRRR